MSLASKHCEPCRGGIPPLDADQVKAFLRHTAEWEVRDNGRRIERTFKFKNYAESFEFVKQAADLAEAEGHHPDISFGWGFVTVSLQTKKIKGLHENDFIMAAKFDQLAVSASATGQSSPLPLESETAVVSSNRQLTPPAKEAVKAGGAVPSGHSKELATALASSDRQLTPSPTQSLKTRGTTG